MLWEELWASTLGQVCGDIKRRVHRFLEETQALGVAANAVKPGMPVPDEVLATWRAVMAPLVRLLEHANSVTSQAPQTPQERWFASTYQPRLSAFLEEMQHPTGERDESIHSH